MTTEMPAWLGYHSFSKSKMCFLFYHRAVRHKVNVCKQYNKKDNASKVADAGTETSGAVGTGCEKKKKKLWVVFASITAHDTLYCC